jgi:hypothetical protein
VNADNPPRWRIRRRFSGRWEIHLRLTYDGAYIYAPLGDWPTWADAIAYVQRAQRANYGPATPAAA